MESLPLITIFFAGVLSFFSPCVLPLMPAYVSYISGLTIEEIKEKKVNKSQQRFLLNLIGFIFGFSCIFILLGASASTLGKFILEKCELLTRIAGIVIIIFGLHVIGLFKIKFLYYEKRIHFKNKIPGFFSSLLFGLAFAFGWTPCVGPILAGVLAYAGTAKTINEGILFLCIYSLGMAVPFFCAAIAVKYFFKLIGISVKFFRYIETTSGIILIILGFLIMRGDLNRIYGLFL
ncbi:MAG: cytochrome c biogenesis CcdA family protein [Thermodesulfobacteriota bacterium]|nr:cytochrome c biogenesis CcdA family protein [Thermodesulfobacteriota bacterium]